MFLIFLILITQVAHHRLFPWKPTKASPGSKYLFLASNQLIHHHRLQHEVQYRLQGHVGRWHHRTHEGKEAGRLRNDHDGIHDRVQNARSGHQAVQIDGQPRCRIGQQVQEADDEER